MKHFIYINGVEWEIYPVPSHYIKRIKNIIKEKKNDSIRDISTKLLISSIDEVRKERKFK